MADVSSVPGTGNGRREQTDSPCFVVDLEPIRELELAFGDDDVGHLATQSTSDGRSDKPL